MIFSYHNHILSVTEQGEQLPEIGEIRKMEKGNDVLDYCYFMYDRTSVYFSMLEHERRIVVRQDKLSHLNEEDFVKVEKASEELAKKMEMLQFTPTEKMVEGMNKKISEYLEYWNSIRITSKNHKHVSDTIKRAESLLKIKDTLDKMRGKEKASQSRKGSALRMIDL